jgi:hypothetical protein
VDGTNRTARRPAGRAVQAQRDALSDQAVAHAVDQPLLPAVFGEGAAEKPLDPGGGLAVVPVGEDPDLGGAPAMKRLSSLISFLIRLAAGRGPSPSSGAPS